MKTIRAIRVAHILGGGILCGASQYVMKIIKGLEGDHFTFRLICIKDGPLADEARALRIPLNVINKSRTADPSTIFKIAQVLRAENIDLIHTQTSKDDSISTAMAKLKKQTIKCQRFMHRYIQNHTRLIWLSVIWQAERTASHFL